MCLNEIYDNEIYDSEVTVWPQLINRNTLGAGT